MNTFFLTFRFNKDFSSPAHHLDFSTPQYARLNLYFWLTRSLCATFFLCDNRKLSENSSRLLFSSRVHRKLYNDGDDFLEIHNVMIFYQNHNYPIASSPREFCVTMREILMKNIFHVQSFQATQRDSYQHLIFLIKNYTLLSFEFWEKFFSLKNEMKIIFNFSIKRFYHFFSLLRENFLLPLIFRENLCLFRVVATQTSDEIYLSSTEMENQWIVHEKSQIFPSHLTKHLLSPIVFFIQKLPNHFHCENSKSSCVHKMEFLLSHPSALMRGKVSPQQRPVEVVWVNVLSNGKMRRFFFHTKMGDKISFVLSIHKSSERCCHDDRNENFLSCSTLGETWRWWKFRLTQQFLPLPSFCEEFFDDLWESHLSFFFLLPRFYRVYLHTGKQKKNIHSKK